MLNFLLKPHSCLVGEVCFESKLILPKSVLLQHENLWSCMESPYKLQDIIYM